MQQNPNRPAAPTLRTGPQLVRLVKYLKYTRYMICTVDIKNQQHRAGCAIQCPIPRSFGPQVICSVFFFHII